MENVVNDICNPNCMEDDGNYDDFLSGLLFKYEPLENRLSPPVNMYNGNGPCICFGVARKFSNSYQCGSVCR